MACAQRTAAADGRLHLPLVLAGSQPPARPASTTRSPAPTVELRFTEVVTFPLPAQPPTGTRLAALHRVLELLHLVAGVSYYKAAAPPRLIAPHPLGEAATAFLTALYTKGLGEYAYRNDLPYVLELALEVPAGEVAPVAPLDTASAASALGRRWRQGLHRQPGGAARRRTGPGALLGQPQPRDRLGQRGLRADRAGRPPAARPGAVRAERRRRAQRPHPGHRDQLADRGRHRRAARARSGGDVQRALRLRPEPDLERSRDQPPVVQGRRGRRAAAGGAHRARRADRAVLLAAAARSPSCTSPGSSPASPATTTW